GSGDHEFAVVDDITRDRTGSAAVAQTQRAGRDRDVTDETGVRGERENALSILGEGCFAESAEVAREDDVVAVGVESDGVVAEGQRQRTDILGVPREPDQRGTVERDRPAAETAVGEREGAAAESESSREPVGAGQRD